MSETGVVKGFKVFNPDWTCSPNGNTKQYTCPGKFEEDITPIRCGRGMHFCKKAADCFNYYNFNPENKVAEVIAYGDIAEEGDKCCTNKLEIVREIPWAELLEIVNMGKGCTGLCNSGNRNSGNRNSGDCNSGDWNSGYLKILDNSECAVIWWRGLSDRQKDIITAIPNFDKEIFKEITGIDVDED